MDGSEKRNDVVLVAWRHFFTVDIDGTVRYSAGDPQLDSLTSGIEALAENEGRYIQVLGDCPTADLPDPAALGVPKCWNFTPVVLDRETERLGYKICKTVLWPLFHSSRDAQTFFDEADWQAYEQVNRAFADAVVAVWRPGCSIIVNGYHLMLVPEMIRARLPDAVIGYYLHVPWPSSELYRCLPVRKEVLNGVLGSDLIAFQNFQYASHFESSCTRILGITTDGARIEREDGRAARIAAIPVGINIAAIENHLTNPDMLKAIAKIERTNPEEVHFDFVSSDRLEPMSGLVEKLRAFDCFLRRLKTLDPSDPRHKYLNKVTLHQICVPSGSEGAEGSKAVYAEVHRLVGKINGEHGSLSYMPVACYHKNNSSETGDYETRALMTLADAAFITPLRDGMNLTSHEFVVYQKGVKGDKGKRSPIILSEFVGAAQCLYGAMLVNPWDEAQMCSVLMEALTLDERAKKQRWKYNYQYIRSHDSVAWMTRLLSELESVEKVESFCASLPVPSMMQAYRQAKRRVLLLDYDGTLVPIARHYDAARPSLRLCETLRRLASDPRNTVYVVSGRKRQFFLDHLGHLPIGFVCEHGCLTSPPPDPGQPPPYEREWDSIAQVTDLSWMQHVQPVLKRFEAITPGSEVEEKEFCISWHFRNAKPDLGEAQKNMLLQHIQGLPDTPIDIIQGKKVIEVRPQGVSKGAAVFKILKSQLAADPPVDFVLCCGDDRTDESMFEELRRDDYVNNVPRRFTVLVRERGTVQTRAAYRVATPDYLVGVLAKLAS